MQTSTRAWFVRNDQVAGCGTRRRIDVSRHLLLVKFLDMADTSSPQGPSEAPKRGEAAWRAERDAIASRNEAASRRARARRQAAYEEDVARRVVEERRERAELAKRRP